MENHYEAYLTTFPFELERTYINTSFGMTHMLMAGPKDGKPILLFQGGNCINPMTMSWFLPLIGEYRVYAPDTIGHPGYSDQHRMSAKDDSFPRWIKELMDEIGLKSCAFIGPSYGAGIILRLATHMPARIDCSILVSPAGIRLGSKVKMIRKILLPLMKYKFTSSEKYLDAITSAMSSNSMKEIDKQVIGDIFKYLKLEQDMPKLTEKKELVNYDAPTLVITGREDIFFPDKEIKQVATEIIPNLIDFKTLDMGHFPSAERLVEINEEIDRFLYKYY